MTEGKGNHPPFLRPYCPPPPPTFLRPDIQPPPPLVLHISGLDKRQFPERKLPKPMVSISDG